MPADPSLAMLWQDADVYVTFDLAAAVPATEATVFAAGWNLVGLLNGDDGFVTSRSESVNDIFAWGGILVRTTRKQFKLTKSFTALESNETTNRLCWPSSAAGVISIPKVEHVKIAFETRDGDAIRRVISSNYAEVTVDGDIVEKETDIASVKFIATIYPNAAGELFVVQPAMPYLPTV